MGEKKWWKKGKKIEREMEDGNRKRKKTNMRERDVGKGERNVDPMK